MSCLEDLADPGYEFRILGSKIAGLCSVLFQVIDLDGCILSLTIDLILNGFPLADPDGTLAASLEEFPVEVIMLLLRLAQQGGKKADAVEILRRFRSCQFAEGREKVPVGRDMIAG